MKKKCMVICILFFVTNVALAQDTDLQIRYISSELVYLNGGRDHGLQTADSVQVSRNGQIIARMVVQAIADRSASCRIVSKSQDPQIGDRVLYRVKEKPLPVPSVENKKVETRKPDTRIARPATRKVKRLTGSVAGQYYQWNDQSQGNYDFTQPTMRMNLRLREIGSPYTQLEIRTRARYDRRSRSYASAVPQKEWRNRIYQCYVDYNNPAGLLALKLGRIIDNPLSGIGYIDGLLAAVRLASSLKFGILAGTNPEWQYADFQPSLQKYGAYFTFQSGEEKSGRLETSLAMAGEYHSATVSREFLYLQNQYRWNQKLWIYQSSELDINRGWRKEKSGQTMGLSNFYLNATYDVLRWMNMGLSLDSRQNFWTYEYRTISDSLFDDMIRRGVRTQFAFRLPGSQSVNTSFGFSKRDSDTQPTYSYTLAYSNNDVLRTRYMMSLYAAGFSSPMYNGVSAHLSLGKNLNQSIYLSLRYGNSTYQINQGGTRVNQQFQMTSFLSLGRHPFVNVMYEYDLGDDENGHRSWVELGYRF